MARTTTVSCTSSASSQATNYVDNILRESLRYFLQRVLMADYGIKLAPRSAPYEDRHIYLDLGLMIHLLHEHRCGRVQITEGILNDMKEKVQHHVLKPAEALNIPSTTATFMVKQYYAASTSDTYRGSLCHTLQHLGAPGFAQKLVDDETVILRSNVFEKNIRMRHDLHKRLHRMRTECFRHIASREWSEGMTLKTVEYQLTPLGLGFVDAVHRQGEGPLVRLWEAAKSAAAFAVQKAFKSKGSAEQPREMHLLRESELWVL